MTTAIAHIFAPFAGVRNRVSKQARKRRDLRRERIALMHLDDRMLRDIGITRDMARREAGQIYRELPSVWPLIR